MFNDILGKAKSVANFAGKKTEDAVLLSRLNISLMQHKSMLQSTYERIGSLHYLEAHKGLTANPELLSVCFGEVDSLTEEIQQINQKIEYITQGKSCPNCGFHNEHSSVYCGRCGRKV